MRNLKRVLSLALAAIMLMGMMIMGTSAANVGSFGDIDDIDHVEAASIITGLEIFTGNELGNFDPSGKVTRAMMATIICKLLHKSDVNVKIYEGTGKFKDAVGNYAWAEGYITMCNTLGIVNGYSDSVYGVDDKIQTWQAAFMLERALGYWLPGDPDQGDQLSAMKTASQIGLFGDLDVRANDLLTRDQVAEMTYNALFAQQVRWSDDRGNYVKANDDSVSVVAGTKDPTNTLARNVFGMYWLDGTIIANGMTDIDLAVNPTTGPQTYMVFDEVYDVNDDGRKDGEGYIFNYATGLDMIGHAARAYYTIKNRTPVVVAIVDRAVKAEVVASGAGKLSDTAKNAGFNKVTSETVVCQNYVLDDEITYSGGKPVLLISNTDDLTVDYAIVLVQSLDYVKKVAVNTSDADDPITTYTVEAGTDSVTSYNDHVNAVTVGNLAAEDYVIVTCAKERGEGTNDLRILQAAPVDNDVITKVTRNQSASTYADTSSLTGSATYKRSAASVPAKLADISLTGGIYTITGQCSEDYAVTPYRDVTMTGDYRLIFDNFGRLIALAPVEVDRTVNVAYVAQFGRRINPGNIRNLNDDYVMTALIYFADGTSGMYIVDTNVRNNPFYGSVAQNGDFTGKASYSLNGTGSVTLTALNTTATATDTDDVMGDYIKLWNVRKQDDGTVLISELKTDVDVQDTVESTYVDTATDGSKTMKTGVTFAKTASYYHTNTVLFAVKGDYNANAADYGLKVSAVIGAGAFPNNVKLITGGTALSGAKDEAHVGQVAYTDRTRNSVTGEVTYHGIDAMLLTGYEMITAQAGVYFYGGNYSISKTMARAADGNFSVTFTLYDRDTGDKTEQTYDGYKTFEEAERYALSQGAGFYRIHSDKLQSVYATTDSQASDNYASQVYNANSPASFGSLSYVVKTQFTSYDDWGDTITLYTTANVDGAGLDATKAEIIDLSGNKLESLADYNALINRNVKSYEGTDKEPNLTSNKISYTYDINTNKVGLIFINGVVGAYSKDYGQKDPDKTETEAKIWVDTSDGGTSLVVYSNAKTFTDDDVLDTLIDTLLATEKYKAVAVEEDPDTPNTYLVKVTLNSGVIRNWKYVVNNSANAKANAMFYTVDGEEKALDTGDAQAALTDDVYFRYKVEGKGDWIYTNTALDIDDLKDGGIVETDGWIAVTAVNDAADAAIGTETPATLLNGVTKVKDASDADIYVAAKDAKVTAKAAASVVGTAYKCGSDFALFGAKTFAELASSGVIAKINVGFVQATIKVDNIGSTTKYALTATTNGSAAITATSDAKTAWLDMSDSTGVTLTITGKKAIVTVSGSADDTAANANDGKVAVSGTVTIKTATSNITITVAEDNT